MGDSDAFSADPLGQIADEFVEAIRRGQRPSVEEFARRYPAHADDLRDILPALGLMEQAKSADDTSGEGEKAAVPPLRQLGDYEILREVGRGGMGVVYEAQQLSLGRHVAIKVLSGHALLDARKLGRFEREARSAARLHHTNIVPVFGVGEQDGLHYYVMQFIPGLGLDAVLEELRRLQAGKLGSGSTQGPTGGELRAARKEISSTELARSLMTGRFTPAAELEDDGPAARGDATAAATASAAADPAAPVARPVAVRPPDTVSLSSSSVVLPGSGRLSGTKPLTYWQSVARIGVQVAGALEYAHRQGIQHRDIKPSNLLLDTTGTVWVTDFGLAKADDQQDLTHTGDILGTLRYMPPEAFDGRADARGDVYSLGLTLYELLALRPAFEETERSRLVKQVTTAEPRRLDRLNRAVPRDLVTIVHKAIERDPAHRYRSAAELEGDLQRFLDDEPIQARRQTQLESYVRWARRHPETAALGGVLTAVLVLITAASLLAAGHFNRLRLNEARAALSERAAREEAQREADKANEVRNFLVSIFELSDPHGQPGTRTARQILDEAEKSIPEKFADQPELQKELLADVERLFAKITANAPLAMILEAGGTVQLHSARNPDQRAVPQALLYTGDRLSLGADGHAQLVILADLHKERLRPGAEATIRRKGCEPADAVSERARDPLWTFARLPKGTFYMGWSTDLSTGKPIKGVRTEIKEDFEIAVHDVTQGQWEAVMGDNPSSFTRVQGVSDEERKLFPVEMVSWDDAQEFIRRLNDSETRRGSGYRYRLPSEAEWEYACRGGATSEEECSYHFYFAQPTNDLSSRQANFYGDVPFGNADRGPNLRRPTRVGAYPPNKLGLCDMHGNVWQWCADAVGAGRVSRGGSWRRGGESCRAAERRADAPSDRYYYLGFRLARVPAR